MSISYRSGSVATGAGSVVCTKPAAVANGDVLIATGVTDSAVMFTPTTGFTLLQFNIAGGGTVVLGIKVATNNEPASYTFGDGSGTFCLIIVDAFSGVSQFDTTSSIMGGNTADVLFPDITTLTNNAWHYASYNSTAAPAPTAPSGYQLASIQGSQAGLYKLIPTPQLITGVKLIGAGGAFWTSFSVALRQASGSLLGAGIM